MTDQEIIKQHLSDWRRRLTSGKLYKIKDKSGNVIPFIPNEDQLYLLDNLHYNNIILKARQRGFSTLIQILMLDQALFYDNVACGVIAQTLPDAKNIFDNKIKFAYEQLPKRLKINRPLTKDSADTLQFNNGSSIYVSTSFRGGTLQYLHVSEFGKICAKSPEKALEIKTGALEAVGIGQYVFIESTAEGKSGTFFDYCEMAQKLQKMNKTLNEKEYKFFFFSRHQAPEYRIYDDELVLTSETLAYFEILKDKYGIVCDNEQMKRYQTKKDNLQDNMFREYPSVPDEAFSVAVEGSYYAKWIDEVYKTNRLCKVAYDRRLPLYTARDLGGTGGGDNMDIWFFQIFGKEFRLIDWFTGIGYSIQDIHHEVLVPKKYDYAIMFMPHDAEVESMNDHKTRSAQLRELGYNVRVLERTAISDRHNEVRDNFKYCYFDSEHCTKGLEILKEYQRKRNDSTGAFMDEAMKNTARHTADSFGYAIQSFLRFLKPSVAKEEKPERQKINSLTGQPMSQIFKSKGWSKDRRN